jgi:hypothetical protein
MTELSDAATRIAVGAYVAWLGAVVLLIAGRHTPFPLLPSVSDSVVAGALALFCFGCVRLGRRTIAWLR